MGADEKLISRMFETVTRLKQMSRGDWWMNEDIKNCKDAVAELRRYEKGHVYEIGPGASYTVYFEDIPRMIADFAKFKDTAEEEIRKLRAEDESDG